jgi:hypothetical protein
LSWQNWLQVAALVCLVLISTPLLGAYIARVFAGGAAPGDRLFLPVERAFGYRELLDPRVDARGRASVRTSSHVDRGDWGSSCAECEGAMPKTLVLRIVDVDAPRRGPPSAGERRSLERPRLALRRSFT